MQDGQYGSVRPNIQTVQGYGGEEGRGQDGRGVGWGAGDVCVEGQNRMKTLCFICGIGKIFLCEDCEFFTNKVRLSTHLIHIFSQ